jgi:hypothetical protein
MVKKFPAVCGEDSVDGILRQTGQVPCLVPGPLGNSGCTLPLPNITASEAATQTKETPRPISSPLQMKRLCNVLVIFTFSLETV